MSISESLIELKAIFQGKKNGIIFDSISYELQFAALLITIWDRGCVNDSFAITYSKCKGTIHKLALHNRSSLDLIILQ